MKPNLDSNVEIGDYVLVSRWGDHSYYDPWSVGILEEIKDFFGRLGYRINGYNVYYPNCWKITKSYGRNRIRYAKKINQYDFKPYNNEKEAAMKSVVVQNKDMPAFPTTIGAINYPGMTKKELVAAIILGGMYAEGKLQEFQGPGWNHFKAADSIAEQFLYKEVKS